MSKPKPPRTPEYETVKKENAIKNLKTSNALIDRNFDAMAAGIRRDTTSSQAGANSADTAIRNARRSAYSGEPMAIATGAAAESINADAATLVGDDASGLREFAAQGERQRNMARNSRNTLAQLGHNKSMRDSAAKHAQTMSTIDLIGAGAGAAYYASDGFSKNPLASKTKGREGMQLAGDTGGYLPEQSPNMRVV